MTFAKNGAAIIGGMIVPASEVLVLSTLAHIGRPATVPEIAMDMKEILSDASLYTLLRRLQEKRGLVTREEAMLEVHGRPVRRVRWTAHQAATAFFQRKEQQNGRDIFAQRGAEVPG
jgi:predicted transcriptional regulator